MAPTLQLEPVFTASYELMSSKSNIIVSIESDIQDTKNKFNIIWSVSLPWTHVIAYSLGWKRLQLCNFQLTSKRTPYRNKACED